MFDEGVVTFREFAMRETLPLATIQNAVLEFLRGRDDGVVFGAQAVNGVCRRTSYVARCRPAIDARRRIGWRSCGNISVNCSTSQSVCVRLRVVEAIGCFRFANQAIVIFSTFGQ